MNKTDHLATKHIQITELQGMVRGVVHIEHSFSDVNRTRQKQTASVSITCRYIGEVVQRYIGEIVHYLFIIVAILFISNYK